MLPMLMIAVLAGAPGGEDPPSPQDSFESLTPRFDAFRQRNLTSTEMAELKRDMKDFLRELEQLERGYTRIALMKEPRWKVGALARLYQLYAHTAEAIEQIPTPRLLTDRERVDEFHAQLKEQAVPLRERAADALNAAEAKSKELGVQCPELDAARVEAAQPKR